MATLPPPEIFVTDAARVTCDGDEHGVVAGGVSAVGAGISAVAGGDGHPRVWLQIGDSGFADCGYCDRRFVLAGGPADHR